MPIVALTANALEQDREACIHAGMDDHLAKPFGTQQMRILLDRWLPRYGHQGRLGRYVPQVAPQPVKAAPPDAALDPSVLAQLRGLKNDHVPDLLARVLSLFHRASPLEMEQISHALQQGDTAQARRLAHALKASSGNIGAVVMGRLCAELEHASRNGELALSREINVKLVAEHSRVMAAVGDEIATLQKSQSA
ncbi:MAG: response regulator [Betaproteobacteria bacterium]|nr:response regulator [Betaproteobacteria bacterium]